MDMSDVVKGFLTGILISIIIIYSLRPKVPYPKWMLATYEHPWAFLVSIGIAFWLLVWDRVVGALSFIVVATLIIDYHMFGKRYMIRKDELLPIPMSIQNDFPTLPTQSGDYIDHHIETEGPPLHSIELSEDSYSMFSPF